MGKPKAHRDGFFSRPELELRWGVTWYKIMLLEKSGALPVAFVEPRINHAKFYREEDVLLCEDTQLHLRKKFGRRKGNIASEAFKLFRAGKDLADIVITLGLSPESVDTLYDQYRNRDLGTRSIKRDYERIAAEAEAMAKMK